jgi:hypothetical protein
VHPKSKNGGLSLFQVHNRYGNGSLGNVYALKHMRQAGLVDPVPSRKILVVCNSPGG